MEGSAAARPRPAQAVVLVVEDDHDNGEALAEYLRSLGLMVHVSSNGYDALDIAPRLLPDVILMDLKMRGIDGWEVTRRLTTDPRTRHIPIVAVSACVFPEEVEAATRAGCVGFVAKPIDLRALAESIDTALDGGTLRLFADPAAADKSQPQY